MGDVVAIGEIEARADAGAVPRSFAWHRNATFAALLVGYAGYYLCRSNLSCAFEPMKGLLGAHPKEAFGWIQTAGTIAYALGKVVAGPLADSRGGRWVFFAGLAGSVVASLIFGLGHGLAFFLGLWGVNLLFQSMGWGGLVNVLARWFPSRSYGTAMGAMSISYQFGGAVAQVLAGALLAAGLGWQALFVIPALALALLGLGTNPLLVNDPVDVGHARPGEETAAREASGAADGADRPSYLGSFVLVARNPLFWVMCGLSFVLTLLRKTFEFWVPTYFTDMGATASTAAFESAVFPLLGCAGTFATGWFSDRFLGGRRAPVMAVLLVALSGALVALGHAGAVASFTGASAGSTTVALVGLTGFLLLGAYSIVGGVAALDFGGKRAAGTAAGLLDGTGYLGASLGGIGMAKVLATWHWNGAFSFMAVLAAASVVLCAILWRVTPTRAL